MSACSKAEPVSSEQSSAEIAESGAVSAEAELPSYGDMDQVMPGLRAMGENGMFVLEQYFSGAMNLLYVDFVQQQEVFVCAEPNCTHNTEACTSYIPFVNDYNFPSIASLKGQLYLVLKGSMDDQKAYISELSADGREQRKIAEFEAGESIWSDLFADDKFLYCMIYRIHSDTAEDTAIFLRIDRQTGEKTELYEFPKGVTYNLNAVSGGSIAVVEYPSGTGTTFNHWLLNPNADIEQQLSEPPLFVTKNESHKEYISHNVLCISDLPTGMCTDRDLGTGEEWSFHVTAEALNLPAEPENFSCSVEELGIYTLQAYCPKTASNQTTYYQFVYDSEQEKCIPFSLPRNSEYVSGDVVIFDSWQDNLVVYIGDKTVKMQGDSLSLPNAVETILSQYALLSKDDYIHSNPNYQIIQLP